MHDVNLSNFHFAVHLKQYLYTPPSIACRNYTCHIQQWQPYETPVHPCNRYSDSLRNLRQRADAPSASRHKDVLSHHSAHAYSLPNAP
jgi:hypothetical protein